MLLALSAFALWFADLPAVLWKDPGRVETKDFGLAAGSYATPPRPPFRFLSEPPGGTSLKIQVSDASGLEWRVKSGPEARVESFITRLVSALGYFAEVTWFVKEGVAEGLPAGHPNPRLLDSGGRFAWVSFELREPSTRFLPGDWTWTHSPFMGTREWKGLKVLVMLLSNWDNKDARDENRGSNAGIWERDGEAGRIRAYFVNDWGQSLGAWKTRLGNGTCWDCRAFTEQTRQFVIGTEGNRIRFGYRGQHTADFSNDITKDDVGWLMGFLGRVTDAQIRTGFLVSGASREEEECFTRALRARIERLRDVVAKK